MSKHKCINCGAEIDKFNTTQLRVKTISIEGKVEESEAVLKVCDDCFEDAREMMKEFEEVHKHNES